MPFAKNIRENGFGVTTIDSRGKENEVTIMKVYMKRRQIAEATALVKKTAPAAIVSVSDIKRISGGYIKK